MQSPVGVMTLVASGKGLAAVLWEKDHEADGFDSQLEKLKRNDGHPILQKTKLQLEEYFSGQRKEFNLPLDFHGTPFQKQVWKELLNISYGQTKTYSYQANRIGDIKKVRAVANANGKNPISIIAPCHRVIGKDGSLTGFAGGLEIKEWLINHEKEHSY